MVNVILLGLVSLLTDVSSEMVYPLIPLFLTERLGAGPAVVGLIEGAAESLASLLKVVSGHLSDRSGRRKPLAVIGYGLATIGKLLLFLANAWGLVLAGRMVDRFGKGIRTAPRDALIADSVPPERLGRAFGLHRALDTLGATTGVLGAYLFIHFGADMRLAFLWALVPAVLALVFFLPVRDRPRDRPHDQPRYGPHDRLRSDAGNRLRWGELDQGLKAFLLLAFLFTLGNSSNQFLLLRARNLGATTDTVILLYLVYNLVYTLFSYPAGRLSDRLGRGPVLVMGHLTFALVYAGFAVTSGGPALWALFAAYGLYSAATESVARALLVERAPASIRATVLGLHATLVGAALFPASLLAGALWEAMGPAAPFWFGAGAGALTAAGLWVLFYFSASRPPRMAKATACARLCICSFSRMFRR